MGNEVVILTMDYIIDVAMVISGFIMCFFGYRAFKTAVTCAGLIIGYQIGTFIANFIGAPLVYPFPIVLKIVFAIVVGILAFRFYKKAIVLIVGYFVAQFAYKAFSAANPERIKDTMDSLILIVICIVIGFAVGLLCLYIQRWAIIIAAAIGGGKLIATVAAKYLTEIAIVRDCANWVIDKLFQTKVSASLAISGLVLIIFCVAGIVIQGNNTK